MSNESQESQENPTTRESLFKQFRHASSYDRIQPYKSGRDEIDALALYAWNIELSEAFYPLLQNLEVGLRNRIHTSITVSYGGNSYWFDDPAIVVEAIAKDSVEEAERKIRNRGESLTPSAVVSQLKFGFWTGILSSAYDVAIWRRPDVLQNTFPYMPGSIRSREQARNKFRPLKDFRNKVFHHEPIWNLDLEAMRQSIYDALGWLDPSLVTVTKILDKFPEVNTADYRDKLKKKLMSACPVETKVLLEARRKEITITLVGIVGDRFYSSGS